MPEEFADTQENGAEMQEQFSQNFAETVAEFLGEDQSTRKLTLDVDRFMEGRSPPLSPFLFLSSNYCIQERSIDGILSCALAELRRHCQAAKLSVPGESHKERSGAGKW